MLPKPRHLGPEYATQFKDSTVVAAYGYRPPYPPEVFTILADLLKDEPRALLDVGCGDGAIARNMVEHVERVDAVDFSANMLAQGKTLPNGDHPRLRWIHGAVEDAPLQPPYALITAGASLHWMDWEVVLPRFQNSLTPNGYLALIYDGWLPLPWDSSLRPIIQRYTTNKDYQPYDTVAEIEKRKLFQRIGQQRTAPITFTQPIDHYIESFHARNGFSRERMGDAAAAFDKALQEMLALYCPDGMVRLQVVGRVIWGKPTAK